MNWGMNWPIGSSLAAILIDGGAPLKVGLV